MGFEYYKKSRFDEYINPPSRQEFFCEIPAGEAFRRARA
jgi:hypothetical protein